MEKSPRNKQFFKRVNKDKYLFSLSDFISSSLLRLGINNVENINIAVMGCIVNGPGESKHANIGISLPGTNESPSAPVYVDGEKVTTLKGENIKEDFLNIVETYIVKNYEKIS